jgi:DNA-binding response OmpR family regulator
MTQTTPHILVVDDDEAICRTLSAIIQAEGYLTTTTTTAREAIEKTQTKFFNLALLDINLPDLKGTRLLAQLQEITPETVKIMVTGYPSLQNAVEALNFGADSYVMKPIDPSKLLKTIKDKLGTQKQAEKLTREKLAEWVQSQARKKQSSNFEDVLGDTASELTDFGLTRTQAKVYITLTALGLASASEISALSKIRREEVYRIIPKLEEHGLVTRKLNKPRKYSAIQPEKAIKLLVETKLKNMKEEIDKLNQKQVKLIPRLKTTELALQPDKCSIEVIRKHDLLVKLVDMAQNAKRQIDAILPLENLKYAHLNYLKDLKGELTEAIKIRIITESHEPDTFTESVMQYSQASNNQIEIRQAKELQFNIVIVDSKEAIWGEFQHKKEKAQSLWTNDPTQIAILKTCFQSRWKKSLTMSVPRAYLSHRHQ